MKCSIRRPGQNADGLFVFVSSVVLSTVLANFCTTNYPGLNSKLLGAYTWVAQVPSAETEVDLIYISFCEALNFDQASNLHICNGAMACRVVTANTKSKVEMLIPFNESDSSNIVLNNDYLILTGPKCSENSPRLSKVLIRFLNDKHLGSPQYLLSIFCHIVLNWRTSAIYDASSKSLEPRVTKPIQVPCYVVDDTTGFKYDLSHLMKSSEAHKVEAAKTDIYINVCQAINDPLMPCGPNTAACLVLQGASWISIGVITPDSKVKFAKDSNDLVITYPSFKTGTAFQNCKVAPYTEIRFRCPSKRGRLNRPPRLMTGISCHYMIEWETDHACPEHAVLGDPKDCKLNVDGNIIELARLRNPKDFHRVPNVTINGVAREVVIDFCRNGIGNGGACGSMGSFEAANVCFKDTEGYAVRLGSQADARLRYTDGSAILVYPDGSNCKNGSRQRWSTVIEFVCHADSTFGSPVLNYVDDAECIVHLKWETVLSCIPDVNIPGSDDYNDFQETCIHTGNNFTFDLSFLSQSTGPSVVLNQDQKFPFSLLLDVCAPIRRPENTTSCPYDSAVCAIDHETHSISYGRYSTKTITQTDGQHMGLLEFHDGDPCFGNSSMRYRTKLHMVCVPGAFTTQPRFLALDEKDCVLHLEWHTSAICPQVSLVNSSCIVESAVHGFKIDLTPLMKLGAKTVKSDEYEYDIRVCGPLPDRVNCSNTSVCRRSVRDNQNTAFGQPSSDLTYNSGLATVLYQGSLESSSITFVCDFDAQVGNPTLLSVQPGSVVFEWATSFACSNTNSHYQSCLVFSSDSSNHLYDLSRLARVRPNKDWILQSPHPKDSQIQLRFHITLCRPLNNAPEGCNPTSSICVETIYPNNTVTVADAGHAVDPPLLAGGQLLLNYSNGDPCVRRGIRSKRRTTIYFLCDSETQDSDEHLQLIDQLDECTYSLLWTTEAACPVRHEEITNECTVVDRLTGDVYNISHMIEPKYYEAENYQFNLCGPIRGSQMCKDENVSVCLIDKDGGKGIALASPSGYQLDFVDVDSLRLSYIGEVRGEIVRVEIKLVCVPADSASKQFFEVPGTFGDKNLHRINFFSHGFCPSQRNEMTPCEIINRDTGDVYDLRPLAKSVFNWEAEKHSPLGMGDTSYIPQPSQKYLFNICKKLNAFGHRGYSCPEGSYACDARKLNQQGISLGRHLDKIFFSKDGIIGIRYGGGDPCLSNETSPDASSSTTKLRSSLVTLACSPNDQEVPRILENSSSESCESVFYMETPAACPVKRSVGKDCKVRDPNFKYEFDLSPLAADKQQYTVVNPKDQTTIQFSVCEPLANSAEVCGGDADAGSCLIGFNGKNTSLGKATGVLQYDTGILTLVYNDGAAGCATSALKRSTTIHFFCDHSALVGSTSPEFESMDENCGPTFYWYTELACPPREETQCKVNTPLGLVDLSPLSNPAGNYITQDNLSHDSLKYVINVCRSVVPKKALTCDFKAGACSVSSNNTVNLGRASKPFFNEEERSVQAIYEDGDPCPKGGPNATMSVHITFECNRREEASPMHLLTESCKVHFLWPTRFACPISAEPKTPNKMCTAINPISNQTIELHSLARADNESPYRIRGRNGAEFSMNICGPARSTSCGDRTGICLELKAEGVHKIAQPSSNLIWDRGVLAIVFTGGDRCGYIYGEQKNMSAIIHFVCPSAGFGSEAPTFVSQSPDDCEYRFVWPTELACNQVLQCAHSAEGETYDLWPLSARPHPVRNIIDPGYQYVISVCRPLEPKRPYAAVHPNAAAVRVAVNTKHVESLGHVVFEPFTRLRNSLSLIYINGSQCEYVDKLQNKARIVFECDFSQDAGEPVLVDIDKDDCVYVFRWRTNLVCRGASDSYQINPKQKCKFEIPQRGITLDLTPLARKSPYQIKTTGPDGIESGYFSMSICRDNPASGCRNSELCFTGREENISYGVAESFFYQGQSLFVKYSDGLKSHSSLRGTHSAIVEFECDPLYETGGPVVDKQYTYVTLFRWKTAHACSRQQLQEHSALECSVSDGWKTYDLSMLSSVSHVWTLEDANSKSTFYLNVCGMGYSWPLEALDKCSNSGVCVRRAGDSVTTSPFSSLGAYSSRRVEIVEAGHVRITYQGGDPDFCHRADHYPTSVIDLVCAPDGDLVGTPALLQEPTSTSCTFRFSWPTRSACADVTDELVMQKNGFLVDTRLHRAFNLTSLFNRTYRVLERRNHNDNYTYLINLGDVCIGANCRVPWRVGPCAQSAVCQSKRVKFMKNIGSVSKQKFLLRGRELVVEIDTGTHCLSKANETVKSIFSFVCDDERDQQKDPVFVYETRTCQYVFTWTTEFVCPDRFVSMYVIDNQVVGGESSATGVVATLSILGVIIAGLMIFFSKFENRMAVRSRTLRFFRTVAMPHYYYSKTESEMQSPLDNDGDTVLLSPSLVLQPEDEDYTPLA